jgi:hypothetical protein
MPLCGSKTTFAIHAIIPMTIFDFLARCFLEDRFVLETNQQDVHPQLAGGVCSLPVSPSPALRVLLLSPEGGFR